MTKKEALTKLKIAFRNTNITTHKLKEIRDLYSEIKELTISDNTHVAKNVEIRVNAI